MEKNAQFKSDYKAILKAYQAAASRAGGKKKRCTKDVPALVKKAKACIKVLEAKKIRDGARSTVREAKIQAQIFSEWVARCPNKINEDAYETMNMLLALTAEYEAAYMQTLREKTALGMRINLGKIFEDPLYLNRILLQEADRIVDGMLKSSKAVSFGWRVQTCYTTASGRRYHIPNCPHCKGREIYPVSNVMIEHLSLLPCTCVTGEKAKMPSREQLKQNAVTIFVDESVRDNPFFRYDKTLPMYEGVYSYVVCLGKLNSENEITRENLIKECASFADDCVEELSNTTVTIEGIYKALMWTAYRYDFHGEVYLFTDNQSVIEKLKKEGSMAHLEELFEKVTLSHISRKMNKRADMVGRKEALFHANPKVVEELLKTKEMLDAMEEERKKGPVTRLQDILEQKQISMIAMPG